MGPSARSNYHRLLPVKLGQPSGWVSDSRWPRWHHHLLITLTNVSGTLGLLVDSTCMTKNCELDWCCKGLGKNDLCQHLRFGRPFAALVGLGLGSDGHSSLSKIFLL